LIPADPCEKVFQVQHAPPVTNTESSARIALLVDPLTLAVKGGDHAPQLARELLGKGYTVRGFGAPPGAIPRSGADGAELAAAEGGGPRAFRPDVLIAYDALSPAAWLGARTARRMGAALVLVEVGVDPADARLHERALYGLGSRLWGRTVRQTADAVVALDPVARERALAEGFDAERVTVIPRGVDLGVFRPGLASALVGLHRIRGRILLYVGRMEENRGVQTLIEAFAQTVGQRTDWTLVLAGEGTKRESLKAMAHRLGIAGNVQWLPRPRPEELPGLMGASTLLAVPALDDSVLGKQVPRAMAAGLPVLASDLGRLAHLVEDGATGLLAQPGRLDSWTDVIRRASSAPQARKRWGDEARRRAETELCWEVVAGRFEALIRRARQSAAERQRQKDKRKPNSVPDETPDPESA